jgi:hypothetical protein
MINKALKLFNYIKNIFVFILNFFRFFKGSLHFLHNLSYKKIDMIKNYLITYFLILKRL